MSVKQSSEKYMSLIYSIRKSHGPIQSKRKKVNSPVQMLWIFQSNDTQICLTGNVLFSFLLIITSKNGVSSITVIILAASPRHF